MKTKKTKSADLQNKRVLFFEIGLLASLALSIWVFSWGTTDKGDMMTTHVANPTDIIELPPVTIPQEAISRVVPHIKKGDIIQIVKNNEMIKEPVFDFPEEEEIFLPTLDKSASGTGSLYGNFEIPVEDSIFMHVQKMPTFQGEEYGKFRSWLLKNIVYPEIALQTGIRGKVVIEFVIEKDGSLGDVKIIQSPDKILSEATLTALKKSPKWEPGMQRDQKARVKFIMPIEFKVN